MGCMLTWPYMTIGLNIGSVETLALTGVRNIVSIKMVIVQTKM